MDIEKIREWLAAESRASEHTFTREVTAAALAELDAARARVAELELVADAARTLADEPDRSKFEAHLVVLEERVASFDATPG